jgi:hypothetical protein
MAMMDPRFQDENPYEPPVMAELADSPRRSWVPLFVLILVLLLFVGCFPIGLFFPRAWLPKH